MRTGNLKSPDLVIREETIPFERRAPLTPENVAELTKDGHHIALARWADRIYSEADYEAAVRESGNPESFEIIDPQDWKTQERFTDSIILGLKDLERPAPGTEKYPLDRTYIHFDHSYKAQGEADERLARFGFDTPTENPLLDYPASMALLLDHEYFIDENGKRTHAFGESAGEGTAAMTFLAWAQAVTGERHKVTYYYETRDDYFDIAKVQLQQALRMNGQPKTLVLGSERGRSAGGAMKFVHTLNEKLGLDDPLTYELWDRQETADRQTETGLRDIEDFDIVFNCTFSAEPCPPFLTDETLRLRNGRLTVIGDVTCDGTPDKNRIRAKNYDFTEFDNPSIRLRDNIYLVSVQHSPSLFPRAASRDFSRQFFPHLQQLLAIQKRNREEAVIHYNSPAGRSLKAFEDNMEWMVNGYHMGRGLSEFKDFPETPDGLAEWLEQNRTQIERDMKLSIGLADDCSPEKLKLYLYGVALGLLGLAEFYPGYHEEKDLTMRSCRDMTAEIDNAKALLQATFNMEALAGSDDAGMYREISRIVSKLMHNDNFLRSMRLSSTQIQNLKSGDEWPDALRHFNRRVEKARMAVYKSEKPEHLIDELQSIAQLQEKYDAVPT